VHLARASLRYASKYWSRSARTCARSTPPHRCGRGAAFAEFEQAWGSQYPAIIQLWKAPESSSPRSWPSRRRSGRSFTPRNAIESLNARFRQACRRRGHFPDEQAALKVLYLVIRTPIKNRTNVTGGTPGWKEAINALTMYYGDKITLN